MRAFWGAVPPPKSHPMDTVHIYFLLDRSGSMKSIADDVVGGFNAFLQGQTALPHPSRLTLVQFDCRNPHEILHAGIPLHEVPPLTPECFIPRGGTPLYDAMFQLIEFATSSIHLRSSAGLPPEHILFITMTDGGENSSTRCEFTTLRTLTEEKTAAGWTFMHLSTDPTTESTMRELRVHAPRITDRSSRGLQRGFSDLNSDVVRYRLSFDESDLFPSPPTSPSTSTSSSTSTSPSTSPSTSL